MIGAALLALPGITLLAVGTPRQARILFGERLGLAARRVVRIAGMTTLFASLVVILDGDDRARHLTGWIGTIGIEALVLALLLAAYGSRSQARQAWRPRTDRRAKIPSPPAPSAADGGHMTKT